MQLTIIQVRKYKDLCGLSRHFYFFTITTGITQYYVCTYVCTYLCDIVIAYVFLFSSISLCCLYGGPTGQTSIRLVQSYQGHSYCMYVCMYVCIYVCSEHVSTQNTPQVHNPVHVHTNNMCTQTHMYMHIRTYTHTYVHTHIRTYMNTKFKRTCTCEFGNMYSRILPLLFSYQTLLEMLLCQYGCHHLCCGQCRSRENGDIKI